MRQWQLKTAKLAVGATLAIGAMGTLGACGKKEEHPPAPDAEPVKPEAKADAEPAKPEPKPEADAAAAAPDAAAAAPDAAPAAADTAAVADALAAAPDAQALAPAPSVPGPAWFGLADGKGVVRLEGGKFTTIALPETLNFYGLATGNGHVYASAIGGLFELDGTTAKKVAGVEYGDFEHAAVGADGTLYGASFDGIALLKAGSVTKEAKAAISGSDNGFEGVAVDGRGRIVAATAYGMFIKDGAAWSKVAIPGLDDQPFFREVFPASGGRVGAVYMSGIVVQKGDGWEVIKPKADMETIVGGGAAENGDLYILGYHTLYIVKPDGNQIVVDAKPGTTFKASQLSSVDGDAQGRVWLTTDNGLVILGADGKLIQQWVPGSVAELAAKIDDLAIEQGGPELPTSFTKAAIGSVSGKFLRAGAPVADVDVELCGDPKMMFTSTPCEDAPFVKKTKSAADGTWSVGDVPAASYKFAVKVGEKWSLVSGDCCTGIKEGQVYDIGSLNLD